MPSNTDKSPPLNPVSYPFFVKAKGFFTKADGLSVRAEGSFVKSERGFTLLELLAVLFIIGIIVSFAGLSIGQRSGHVVRDEAERLFGLVRIASEEAVLQSRELAIEFTQERYRFLELDNDNRWILIEDDTIFRERPLPPDIKVELLVEGASASFEDKKNLPRIFMLSSGELTAFDLTLSLEGENAYTLQGAINGKLNLLRAGEGDFGA